MSNIERHFRCDQETQRGERCLRKATWKKGDEYYCTQHANHYGLYRRGGVRLGSCDNCLGAVAALERIVFVHADAPEVPAADLAEIAGEWLDSRGGQ